MARLISFGDSFTWGTDLKDALTTGNEHDSQEMDIYNKYHRTEGRTMGSWDEVDHNHKMRTWRSCYSRLTWPALLAKDRDLEYVCYAIQGASNQTIIRQFFQYLPHINKDDIVVMNWTWIDRWDFCRQTDETYVDQWVTVRPSGSSDSDLSKIYFKYIQSELWNKIETLKTILLATNTLKAKNIKFLMTSIDSLILDRQYHVPSYIVNLQNEIIDDITWFDEQGFYDWSKTNNFPIHKKGGHPLEEAHQHAFNYIKDYEFTK